MAKEVACVSCECISCVPDRTKDLSLPLDVFWIRPKIGCVVYLILKKLQLRISRNFLPQIEAMLRTIPVTLLPMKLAG